MLVAELRRKLVERMEQVASDEDEDLATLVLTYARALLIALAGRPADENVSLSDLTVGTRTAALILGLHREYVRNLIRTGQLKATKVDSEHQLSLADVMEHTMTGFKSQSVTSTPWTRPMVTEGQRAEAIFESTWYSDLWRGTREEPST